MDIPKHRERIEKVFTADSALKYVEFATKAATNSLPFEEVPKYADAVMLQRYTAVFGHLAYSLREYQTAVLDFAEKSDSNEADRTAEGFAKMFGSYFPPEFSITEGNAWMSVAEQLYSVCDQLVRPGEDVAKLVKRMHYVSFVGMFRSDLFEGLCVGHAPKKCRICGKWFLTTNARHTKYCGGYAPGDKLHRTCRQIGNLKGREQRELADDHPLKQIYEKRLNTINRYVKRGTLDADLAEVMKKLAKDKMLRALSNVAYAKGDYEKEMEQAALKKEAKLRTKVRKYVMAQKYDLTDIGNALSRVHGQSYDQNNPVLALIGVLGVVNPVAGIVGGIGNDLLSEYNTFKLGHLLNGSCIWL